MPESHTLDELAPVINPVAERFVAAGHRLYLVGGIVRDLSRGELSGFDIDFTTDAHPPTIKKLMSPLADAVWSQGERFGTIGASVGGHDLEITTHRAERYDPESRKPVVTFGDRLEEDLSRRDFTINAMAIEVPGRQLHDPFDGSTDLEDRILRTPLSPDVSFTDDPLRMMRAARFISRFGLSVADEVFEAACRLADRLAIVSVERVADETERLLAVADPSTGLEFLRQTGLLNHVLGSQTDKEADLACRLAAGPGGPLVRRAGLLWSTDPGLVLRRLRYSNDDRKATVAAVEAVREWMGSGGSTAVEGRRLVSRAGAPGPQGLAANLSRELTDRDQVDAAERLVAVINDLDRTDDLGPYQSPLSGSDIMAELNLAPGPIVGQAQAFLRERRLTDGPITADEARRLLRRWYDDETGGASLP